jgi:ribonuclease HIII
MAGPSTFSTSVDLSLEGKLKGDLEEQGFSFSKPLYTQFSARKDKLVVTLYSSGKLTVQGKGMEEWISFYFEPQILKSFPFTHPDIDHTPRIGVDEAGKGDFFGPLVIGGVYADEKGVEELLKIGVKDSKTLGDPQVKVLARKIKEKFPHKVLSLFPETYNNLYPKFKNLNYLLAWGHATVIEEIQQKTGAKRALIDQFAHESRVLNALQRKGLDIILEQRTKGESDPVVAAASILARAGFLEGLEKLSSMLDYPLPKGANAHVRTTGKRIYDRLGEEGLLTFAKKHFKTWDEVIGG